MPGGRLSGLRTRLGALARPRSPEALPVTFDRRRIYVLPTAFGAFFACLLLVMLLGALNYNNNPALLLALLLAGAGNTSLFAAHLQLSGLRVAAVEAEPVAAGSPMSLRVHLRGGAGRTRRGLRLALDDSQAFVSLVDGAGEARLVLPTRRRGRIHPGRITISTTRPLGLARAWAYAWPAEPLLVYPRPEACAPPLPTGAGGATQARMHPAGDDVHHLRAYRRGDSRRAIAWKPSARQGALMVREYEQPQGADVELEWSALSLPREERISRLARWIDDAEREGRRYRLQLPGQEIGPSSGPAHRHACLRALALMPTDAPAVAGAGSHG